MKSNIVQQLSAVQVETVARVQQVSNVIAQATSVISEVTVEAQVIKRHWNGIIITLHRFIDDNETTHLGGSLLCN